MDKLIFPAAYFLLSPVRREVALQPGADWETAYYFLDHLQQRRIFQVRAILSKPRRARTTGEKSQNHHFNGHVQQIARETGNGFDNVKYYIKYEAISEGYPFETLRSGDVMPISEADSSTVDCAILIEVVHRVAAEWGIILVEEP